MPTTFPLAIVTPEGEILATEAISLQAPGRAGYFGILARHAPMIAEITRGVLTVRSAGETTWFAVAGGVVEVSHAGVVVLADLASEADSLEEAHALLAEPPDEAAVA